MNICSGFFATYPTAFTAGCCYATIECRSHLDHDPGFPPLISRKISLVDRPGFIVKQTDLRFYSGFFQSLDPQVSIDRIGIQTGDNNLADSCLDNAFDASRCSPLRGTGLQGDVHRASCNIAADIKRMDFRVFHPGRLVESLGNNLLFVDDHATHARVRMRCRNRCQGQLNGTFHIELIGIIYHWFLSSSVCIPMR